MKYLFVIILFLVACQHESKQAEQTSADKSYFDFTKIVQADIDHNTESKCGEEKTVLINGKNETREMDSVDWKKELQLLLDGDLNKPSWKGKFDVQILKDSLEYIYTANSVKIPIRKMTVNYEQKNGKVISVEIEKNISTVLFSNEQQIVYFPEKSFKINARQKAIFMKDFNSEVEIKYLCKN